MKNIYSMMAVLGLFITANAIPAMAMDDHGMMKEKKMMHDDGMKKPDTTKGHGKKMHDGDMKMKKKSGDMMDDTDKMMKEEHMGKSGEMMDDHDMKKSDGMMKH